ncbi:ATP-binding cassette domain-containing protein [Brevibacterium aurantiacum]|uniref:Daunorubicin/doxorubicin resistance ABC transporter ATP-binding protein DrrA n=1 Tax=Brevibacterium aurantiacum TaxID=273384 RepID=A0A2A3X941_BREAU|nr:ATP-binding cassette domain-containing protein [Brevibacterium aurantiacum]PCC20315.1 daunorubicin/doxorubicin resistance ABC transporter ATP-binding protein DrrA [Brevibacterium aurantiacum]
MTDYLIEAAGLVKRYGKHTALDGVDLRVKPGAVLAVLGPNGAGKTTAIRILATLTSFDAGTAKIGGMDVTRQSAHVRRMIGLAGQYATLDEELTGMGNLVLIGRLLDLRKSEASRKAAGLLERFGLTDAAKKPVALYSGGMRRRLDLAASLVGNPRVVFLDEPSVGLDPGKREELWKIIRELTADGVSVLLTTQYLEEADALADEISVINHGRVIAHGTPPDLKQIVGGQAIAIRLKNVSQEEEAASILSGVSGNPVERATQNELIVPVDSDQAMFEVARRFEAAGVGVSEFALRLPSLDEVFFTLTGKPADEDQPDEDSRSHS